MKSKQNLSGFSLGLSAILLLGNYGPVLAGTNININQRLQTETLLAQNLNFSEQYGSAPDRRTGGFRRGGCLAAGRQMIAILPNQVIPGATTTITTEENNSETSNLKQNELNQPQKPEIIEMEGEDSQALPVTSEVEETDRVWFTADQYPSVYFYLPENWANKAEFVLYNAENEVIYSATMMLPGEATAENPREAGVIEVNFKDQEGNIEPLAAGSQYLWEVQVLCDEINRSGNPTVNGWIQLVDENVTQVLNEDLAKVTDQSQKTAVYAENGIWYNLVSTIYQSSDPNYWSALLQEVGVQEVMDSPILGAATIVETYEGDFPPL